MALYQCFKVEIHWGAVQIFAGRSSNLFIRFHAKTFAFMIENLLNQHFSLRSSHAFRLSRSTRERIFFSSFIGKSLNDRRAHLMFIKANIIEIGGRSGRLEVISHEQSLMRVDEIYVHSEPLSSCGLEVTQEMILLMSLLGIASWWFHDNFVFQFAIFASQDQHPRNHLKPQPVTALDDLWKSKK